MTQDAFMSNFKLTEHAKKRLLQRGIPEAWIAAALAHPMRTENDADLVHALIAIPEKGFRMLRVIYNESHFPPSIVTAYFDNQVKPYET